MSMKSGFIVNDAFQLPRFQTELPGCGYALGGRETPPEVPVSLLLTSGNPESDTTSAEYS
jgi:hypothetical protein